jgi:hypothetical protein
LLSIIGTERFAEEFAHRATIALGQGFGLLR